MATAASLGSTKPVEAGTLALETGAQLSSGVQIPSGATLAGVSTVAGIARVNGVAAVFWNGSTTTADGTIHGGTGTWVTGGTTNWTNAAGTVTGTWPGSTAIFQGAPGIVTVDTSGGTVTVTAIQFAVDGYAVTGDTLTLANTAGLTAIRVGDGTAAGASTIASIGAVMAGTSGLDKQDLGTLVLTGASTYTGGTTVTAGTLQIGDGVTTGSIVGSVVNNASLIFNPAAALTYSGAISGSGSLFKQGSGTLTLTGTNSYTGGTSITGGRLIISGGSSLSDSAGLIIGGPGTLELLDANETVGWLSGTGAVALNANCLTVAGGGTVFSGNISGSGCVNKTGAGTLALAGTNTYSGGTTVSGGTLQVTTAAALGTGGLALAGQGTLEASGSFSYGGTISLTPSGGLGGGTFQVDGAETLTLNGEILGVGSLAKTGTGTLILSSTNSSGATNVNAGTLAVSGGQALADTSAVTVASGARLIVQGPETVGSLAGAGQVTLDGSVLTVGRDDSSTVFSGVLDGSGSFGKTGTGTLTLTGAHTYTGATFVNGGTLVINGSVAGDVQVNVGGTLSGSGSIAQTVTVLPSGTLTGSQSGGLTMGALNLAYGSTVNVTLGAASTSAVFDVTGDLTLAGRLNATATPGFGAGIYRIFSYGGTLTDSGMTVAIISGDYVGGLQTSIANQVNLLVESPTSSIIFWNGANSTPTQAILGGSGPWTASTLSNWTNAGATVAKSWNSGFAVFQGTAGTVTVDNGAGQVAAGGMQFVTSGYLVTGGALELAAAGGPATIRVGDGTSAGATTVATIASVLMGTGGVEKTDYGTLILTGANTYTGGTTLSGGTLQIGSGGTSGSIVGDVVDNGALVFNRSDAVTFTGAISGGGSVTQAGAGTLALTGTNTYGGGTAIAAGTLQVSGAGALGTGAVALSNGGTLRASGTFALANAVTLGGGTVLSSAAQAQSLAGGIQLITNNGGTLNQPTGGGTVFTGTVTVSGSNTYSGGTLTGAGTISGVSSGTNTLTGGAVLILGSGTALPINSAALTPALAPSLAASTLGPSSASPPATAPPAFPGSALTATTVSAATVGSTALNTVLVDPAQTLTLNGTVSGAGALAKTGAGTLILAGANSYAGGTAIAAGTLVLATSTAAGTGSIFALNGATLAYANGVTIANTLDVSGIVQLVVDSGRAVQAGQLTGTGSYVVGGSGILDLLSTSTYAGTTSVSGTLAVNGTLGGRVNVANGGVLKGTGTVGNTTVLAGGTVAPGNSIGTLNVAGTLSFAAGSLYQVEVNAAGASDRIAATGTATISGGTVQVLAAIGSYAPETTYTILTAAGGVSGTFSTVTSNLAYLTPALGYDTGSVYLSLVRNNQDFCLPGFTGNQCSTGTAVQDLGTASALYNAVVSLDAATAGVAFDQLSGQIYASAQAAALQDSHFTRDAAFDRLRSSFGTVGAPTSMVASYADAPPLGFGGPGTPLPGTTTELWMQGFGAWGDFGAGTGTAQLDRTIGGFYMGADRLVLDGWRLGALAGYSRSTLKVDALNSALTSDNYTFGLYAGRQWDALGLRLGAAYTWQDIGANRTVAFTGFGDQLDAGVSASTMQLFGELGYQIRTGGIDFEPFVTLAHVTFESDAFTETGGAAALSVAEQNADVTFGTLGLRVTVPVLSTAGTVINARGMIGWKYAFDMPTSSASMAFAGGSPFSVTGVPLAQNAAVVDAGFDTLLATDTTLGLSYSGQFGDGFTDNAIQAALTWRF